MQVITERTDQNIRNWEEKKGKERNEEERRKEKKIGKRKSEHKLRIIG